MTTLSFVVLLLLFSQQVGAQVCDPDEKGAVIKPGKDEPISFYGGTLNLRFLAERSTQLYVTELDFVVANTYSSYNITSCVDVYPSFRFYDRDCNEIAAFCQSVNIKSISPPITTNQESVIVMDTGGSDYVLKTTVLAREPVTKPERDLYQFVFDSTSSKFVTTPLYPDGHLLQTQFHSINEIDISHFTPDVGVFCVRDFNLPLSVNCSEDYARIFTKAQTPAETFETRVCGSVDTSLRIIRRNGTESESGETVDQPKTNLGCYLLLDSELTRAEKVFIEFKIRANSSMRGSLITWENANLIECAFPSSPYVEYQTPLQSNGYKQIVQFRCQGSTTDKNATCGADSNLDPNPVDICTPTTTITTTTTTTFITTSEGEPTTSYTSQTDTTNTDETSTDETSTDETSTDETSTDETTPTMSTFESSSFPTDTTDTTDWIDTTTDISPTTTPGIEENSTPTTMMTSMSETAETPIATPMGSTETTETTMSTALSSMETSAVISTTMTMAPTSTTTSSTQPPTEAVTEALNTTTMTTMLTNNTTMPTAVLNVTFTQTYTANATMMSSNTTVMMNTTTAPTTTTTSKPPTTTARNTSPVVTTTPRTTFATTSPPPTTTTTTATTTTPQLGYPRPPSWQGKAQTANMLVDFTIPTEGVQDIARLNRDQALKKQISDLLVRLYSSSKVPVAVEVRGFTQGSVIVNHEISADPLLLFNMKPGEVIDAMTTTNRDQREVFYTDLTSALSDSGVKVAATNVDSLVNGLMANVKLLNNTFEATLQNMRKNICNYRVCSAAYECVMVSVTGVGNHAECHSKCNLTRYSYCNSRGSCYIRSESEVLCRCNQEYTGMRCESRSLSEGQIIGIIAGCGGAVVIAIIMLSTVYIMKRRRSQPPFRELSPDDEPSNNYGAVPTPSYRTEKLHESGYIIEDSSDESTRGYVPPPQRRSVQQVFQRDTAAPLPREDTSLHVVNESFLGAHQRTTPSGPEPAYARPSQAKKKKKRRIASSAEAPESRRPPMALRHETEADIHFPKETTGVVPSAAQPILPSEPASRVRPSRINAAATPAAVSALNTASTSALPVADLLASETPKPRRPRKKKQIKPENPTATDALLAPKKDKHKRKERRRSKMRVFELNPGSDEPSPFTSKANAKPTASNWTVDLDAATPEKVEMGAISTTSRPVTALSAASEAATSF